MKNKIIIFILVLIVILPSINALADNLSSEDIIIKDEEYIEVLNILELDKYLKDGIDMLPLRIIAEELGYNVNWNKKLSQVEIEKDGLTTSLKNGKNIYFTFENKLLKLSKSPEILNGTTYVPFEFFQKVLGENLKIIENKLIKVEGKKDISENMEISGYIKDIVISDGIKYLKISVEDSDLELDEIIIHLRNDTEYIFDDEEVDINNLKVGNYLKIISPKLMTMSLPPQTTADNIEIYNFIEVEKNIKDGISYPYIKNSVGNRNKDIFNSEIDKFLKNIKDNEVYDDLKMDYNISLLNENMISLIFNGTYNFMGEEHTLLETFNFNLKYGEKIEYTNYFKDDYKSKEKLNKILSDNVKKAYGKEFKAEDIYIYFTEKNIVIYYYEEDSIYKIPIEIYIMEDSLESIIVDKFKK